MFKILPITSYIAKSFKKVPLKFVLVVPFVIQICLATGAVGLFTFYNGQQRVNAIAESLSGEIGDRISTELNHYLHLPSQINQANNQVNIDAISIFLRGLKYGKNGRVFIIERSGLVVGASTSEQNFLLVDGKPQRLNILNSKDALSQTAAKYLKELVNVGLLEKYQIGKENFYLNRPLYELLLHANTGVKNT